MSSKESLTTDRSDIVTDPEECDSDQYGLLSERISAGKRVQHERRLWAVLSVNAFVLLLNIGVLLMVTVPKGTTIIVEDDVHLPHWNWIAPAIETELRTFDDTFHISGPYRGTPRPELDEAWAEPVRNYTVRVPKPGWRNASSPNRILTEFQDKEGGIMGTFSFLHNLHCLKTIREYMLPDYYPDTAKAYKATPEAPLPPHIDHCIDILRQSELCHADMSLKIFEWHENNYRPVDIHHTQHVCANREKLDKFLEAHSVPPFGSILVHPWTGKSPY
ncbi:hypothetical protein K431DRAFT_308168 [Polychaeton citri CBS 116435]|uniref:Cyclochlorotine biosynthesis protein O n=1 Tax=Polychaeton citri CBS 116435 TaxID=1314669 RepID=A0A9P4PY51_9PEZI|nr:hypothetical protein K431DRAFT_308168 [Polychaeton citri CBS 116435]